MHINYAKLTRTVNHCLMVTTFLVSVVLVVGSVGGGRLVFADSRAGELSDQDNQGLIIDLKEVITDNKKSDLQIALDLTYEIESLSGYNLIGDNGQAIGPLHIWPIMVEDVNRIVSEKGLSDDYPVFTYDDRHDLDMSCQIFSIFQWYYGQRFSAKTGQQPTVETYVRMWNGGPSGYQSDKTLAHWRKAKEILNNMS